MFGGGYIVLLNIYFCTSILNLITVVLNNIVVKKRLIKEGYAFVKGKKSFLKGCFTIIEAFIPIYNVISTICVFCFNEKVYEIIEEELLEDRRIIYKASEDEVTEDRELNTLSAEDDKIFSDKNILPQRYCLQ